MTRLLRVGLVACWLLVPTAAAAQVQSARVTVPAGVMLNVSNVAAQTATLAPVTVSYDNLVVLLGRRFRISVKADAATFTRPTPTGGTIPATNVSWTTSSAVNGTGSSGGLNSASYVTVFESTSGTTTGSVAMSWRLAAPGGGIRSGNHTLTVRYRLEAF